jgi:hypothetical protein
MSITYTYHICQLKVDETNQSPDGAVEYIKAYIRGEDENGFNTTEVFDFKLPFEEIVYQDEEQTIIDNNGNILLDENGNEIKKIVSVKYIRPIDWNNFVPFEDLTPEIVVGWIETLLEESEKEQLKNTVAKKIQSFYGLNAEQPTMRPATPWNVETLE